MFLSGTVLCTINTLVEHGLKNAVPVKTRCASDHFAAPPHPCTKALRLHARESFALAELRARPPRRAQSPKFPQHAVWTRFKVPPVSPPKTRDRRYFTKAVETRCGKVKTKVHTLHAGLYML